jgi:acyl-CoA thioesterase I
MNPTVNGIMALTVGGALVMLTACRVTRADRPIREADYSGRIRVACIGDSITYGFGIKDRERNSYPAQLGALLGQKWEVRNFGVNGATALIKGTRPYVDQPAYREALAFKPHVVVIKLGTNDTNAKSWPTHKQIFTAITSQLFAAFQVWKPGPVFTSAAQCRCFGIVGKNTTRIKS